jgi:uncharacterized protein (DUF488 family)
MRPRIYSIGHSSRSLDELLDILQAHDISLLVDVRSFPGSRRHPHFSRDVLSEALRDRGIDYTHFGNTLGGRRKISYEEHMLTADFLSGLQELERLARAVTTVFMCAEKVPWQCHRSHIARALMKRGWQVIHILDESTIWDAEQPLLSYTPDS